MAEDALTHRVRELGHRASEMSMRPRRRWPSVAPRTPLQETVDPFNNSEPTGDVRQKSTNETSLTLAKVVQTVNERCDVRPSAATTPAPTRDRPNPEPISDTAIESAPSQPPTPN